MATRVPKEPPEIRILNPYFIQEAAFTLIGLPFNNGLMGRGVRLLGRVVGGGLGRGAPGGKQVGKEAHPWKWADELWKAQPHPPPHRPLYASSPLSSVRTSRPLAVWQ